MRFRLPNINSFSFWLGFILSAVIWWIISILRPIYQQIRINIKVKATNKKEIRSSASIVEEHYRRIVLLQAQQLHLAAPLFSLDEILISPRLIAPPPRTEPGNSIPTEDIVETTLPYLPEWPELAAVYDAPTLSLFEALSGNSDIVLTGQPGIGKTVALASLASSLARREVESGLSPDLLPFLIHVADINFPLTKEEPLNSLINLICEKASILESARIASFIRRTFVEGRALLLIDGTDELTPDGLKDIVESIRFIKHVYPETRIITTASNDYLGGLGSLNFATYALAAWNSEQRMNFLEKWGDLWKRLVEVESWAQTNDQVDPLLLTRWLNADSITLTPLELTLKAWGAFAGDIQGPNPIDGIETHIKRVTPANTPREALESLAIQVCLAADPIFDPHKAQQWVKSFELNESDLQEAAYQAEKKERKTGKSEKQKTPSLGIITKMAESGLLSRHRNNRMRFIHPIFAGYLAGKPLENYVDTIIQQPPWIGRNLAMRFLAAKGDATPLSNDLLSQPDRPLFRKLLTTAHWLRDAPPLVAWRKQVLMKLADLFQQNGQPLGLRGQAMAALVHSGDPGSTILFRQMMMRDDADLECLGALGSGALHDEKSIELLTALFKNPSPNVRRAACLALAVIGTTAAIDSLASALLQGDETLRDAAAVALANNTIEGHNMLREGAEMKDELDVRHATIHGLGHIHQVWAEELLTKLQVEDDQWIVRNAASAMLEELRKMNGHIQKKLLPPSESPWLIAFAGKQGMGVSPDIPPTDLLLMALKSENVEERIASLTYLRMIANEGVFAQLYHAMYGGDAELREAIYQTISEMAARGVDLPDPVQYGVGF